MALSSLGVGVMEKRSGLSSPSEGCDGLDVSGEGHGLTKPNWSAVARTPHRGLGFNLGSARRMQRTGRTIRAWCGDIEKYVMMIPCGVKDDFFPE